MPVLLALCSLLAPSALATPVAFQTAAVHTGRGEIIKQGVLVVEDGQILAVGPPATTPIPEGAEVVDLTGMHVIPGLVDLHSHIGGGRLHEHLAQAQPGITAIDAIDPTHHSIQRAQAGGITFANVMPGSGKLVGGQTAYLDLVDTNVIDDMLVCTELPEPWAGEGPSRWNQLCGGIKMANGTNPQGGGGDPATRMGSAFLQREALLEAAQWLEEHGGDEAEDDDGERSPHAEALAQVLAGHRIVHFHSHRADDIVTVLRLRQEFGFPLVLHHGSEGFKVAELIASEDVVIAINVLDTPGGKEETLERSLSNPAQVAEAGARVAIITDDPVQDSRLFLRSAGLAMRGGMDGAMALRAITLTPAEAIGLDHRIGSLEVGKEADFVVLDGPPLSTFSLVQQTWNNGQLVFDRSDPLQAPYATGGDDALVPPSYDQETP